MTTATPGPWKVNHGRRGKFGTNPDTWTPLIFVQTDFHASGQIKNGPEATICEIARDETATCVNTGFQHRIRDDEAEANARLIAAAPELLDVLTRLIHMAECNTTPGPNTLAQARAAIAKAQGA